MILLFRYRLKNVLKKFVKGYLRDQWWSIYGKQIATPVLGESPRSFLFICKGNICRSPFAEYLARKMNHKQIEGLSFSSAGLQVTQPMPSPGQAVAAARLFGIDLSDHTSCGVNEGLIQACDMALVMEARQLIALRKAFPSCKDKIFLMPLFDKFEGWMPRGYLRYNIQDPYGKALQDFVACFMRIERCVANLLPEGNSFIRNSNNSLSGYPVPSRSHKI